MAPVDIYTTRFCPYCMMAKKLLAGKNVNFNEIDVGRDWDRRAEMVQRASGGTTVPQIFIGSRHVGGCDDLQELERMGKLDALLAGGEAAA